jgi:predicted kinase
VGSKEHPTGSTLRWLDSHSRCGPIQRQQVLFVFGHRPPDTQYRWNEKAGVSISRVYRAESRILSSVTRKWIPPHQPRTEDRGPRTEDRRRWPIIQCMLIMLLLWLLPLLFQPPPRFATHHCIMSDEWETPSHRNRDRRRRNQKGKGPPMKSRSANMVSPPAADADAEADANDAHAVNANDDMPSTSEVSTPFLLILAGLPGSGKSTLAEQLVNANGKYVHVNQDTLGTRKKCLSAVRNAVLAGKYPIIDRCNFDATQRRWFIDLARQELGCAVHCVVLVHVDRDQCLYRCQQRRGHPTLPPNKAAQVIGFVQKDWRPPTANEGIDQIWNVTNDQQYQDVVAFYS